jgi:hypothetical protein
MTEVVICVCAAAGKVSASNTTSVLRKWLAIQRLLSRLEEVARGESSAICRPASTENAIRAKLPRAAG